VFAALYTDLLYFKTSSQENNRKETEEGTAEAADGDKWKQGTEKE